MTEGERKEYQDALRDLEGKITTLKGRILGEVKKRPAIMDLLILLGIVYTLKKPLYIAGGYFGYNWLKGKGLLPATETT